MNRMFSGGKGTKEEPYLVSSVNDLIEIKNYPESHFRQIRNIDLNGINWEPLPDFHGTYDGQNFKIKNLSINSNESYVGLFGVCENATLKNIKIINAKVQGNDYGAGILSGGIYDSEVTDCHIIKSTVQGDFAGGLAIEIGDSTVSRCGIEQIEVQGSFCGGLAYNASYSYIDNCYVSGTLNSNYLGTFVAELSVGTIKNCYTVVNMIWDDGVGAEIYPFADNWHGAILNCYTDITVGVTQVTWDPYKEYYNVEYIIIRGTDGGLYLLIDAQDPDPSYAAQPVSGSNWQNYWAPAYIPEGRTTSQMMTKSNFVGWDFENVWTMVEGKTYPRLRTRAKAKCKSIKLNKLSVN